MENQTFTEIQDVLDFMNRKHDGVTQLITWGEMKEKFPKCVKMTTMLFNELDKDNDEEEVKDNWSFRMSDVFIESIQHFETADNAKTLSKYYKCIINVIIDAVGDMVAEREGFDADMTEIVKVESNKRFQEFYPVIDSVADRMFDVA